MIEGRGMFTVGDEVCEAADVLHGVANTGERRLVLLVGIALAPGK